MKQGQAMTHINIRQISQGNFNFRAKYWSYDTPRIHSNCCENPKRSRPPVVPSWGRVTHQRCHLSPCGRSPPQCQQCWIRRGGLMAEQQASPVHSDGRGDGTFHARAHRAAVMRSTWTFSPMNEGTDASRALPIAALFTSQTQCWLIVEGTRDYIRSHVRFSFCACPLD